MRRLQDAMRSHNFTIIAHINHTEGAESIGLKMQEAHVLIFGNPKAGTPLMIASPLLAIDLPLKVLVWQNGDGKVWVSYNSVSYLVACYSVPPELTGNIAGIEGLIEGALHS